MLYLLSYIVFIQNWNNLAVAVSINYCTLIKIFVSTVIVLSLVIFEFFILGPMPRVGLFDGYLIDNSEKCIILHYYLYYVICMTSYSIDIYIYIYILHLD